MKKILTVIIVFLAVFLIYLGFKDKDIYYLSLGDSLANGVNSYGNNDYGYSDFIKDYLSSNKKLKNYVNLANNNKRTIDIIKDITDNVKVMVDNKEKTMQNALIKADIITVSIGINDLFSNITFNNDFGMQDLYRKFEQVSTDLENLFKLLREYSKEDIIFIGFYNYLNEDELNDFFLYANDIIEKIATNYNITYLDVYEDLKDDKYFDDYNCSFPNKLGYEMIANKIISLIDEKIDKKA